MMKTPNAGLRLCCALTLGLAMCAGANAASRTPKSRGTRTTQTNPGATLQKASARTSTKTTSKTGSASRKPSSKKKVVSRSRGQKGPTVDRVTEIQEALAKNGAYPNDPSGKWDSNTIDAMKKFQQANGLTPSGKLNALTLQKLGLGSDVAGRAAPRPERAPTKQ